jgi:hypothetical protein
LPIMARESAFRLRDRCNRCRSSPYGGDDRTSGPRDASATVANPEGMPDMGSLDSSRLPVVLLVPSHCPGRPAGAADRHVALRRVQEDRGWNMVRREIRCISHRRRDRGDPGTTGHRPGIPQDRRHRPLRAARAEMRRFTGLILDPQAWRLARI